MYRRARYLSIAVVSCLTLGQMMAACGQKGDLYLPKPEPAKAQPKPTAAKKKAPPPTGADKSVATGRNSARATAPAQ